MVNKSVASCHVGSCNASEMKTSNYV